MELSLEQLYDALALCDEAFNIEQRCTAVDLDGLDNAGFFIYGDYAVAMGNYYFTPVRGKPVNVEYTFGFIKDKKCHLRINLHHSDLSCFAK